MGAVTPALHRWYDDARRPRSVPVTGGRTAAVVPPLALAFLLAACSTAPSNAFHTLPKEISVSDDGATVVVEGRWRALKELPLDTITNVNAVTVRCHRATNRCDESIAMVVTANDHLPVSGLISSIVFEYEVTSWESGRIRATGNTPATDQSLEIDVGASTADRTSRETTARGAKTSNPQSQQWVLE